MNKQQLIDAVGERVGDRRTAATAVDAVLDTLTSTLAGGERVSLFGFGVFEKVDRAARTARNPATGGTVDVPATSVPRFRAGQALKDAVNGRSPGSTRSPSRTAAARPAPAADAPATATGKKARSKAEPAAAGKKSSGKAAKAKAEKAKAQKAKGKGKGK